MNPDETRRRESAEGPLPAGGSRPPGVLPKNIQWLVLVAIALLIVSTSFFSGQKAKQGTAPATPVGPSPTQLANFNEFMKKQRKEADEAAAKRLADMERREEEGNRPSQRAGISGEADQFAQRRRAKAEAAPFATNFVIRDEEKGDKTRPDSASQIAFRTEEKREEAQKEENSADETDEPKGSGQFRPWKEGNFFRLFEGTTIQTVLANQLDGSFTGPVKCIVTQSVRAKDGSTLLIPAGSRFLGEATRVEQQNQARLAVTFKRLILPNDYSVELKAAPGLDSGGQTGLKDKVNNHRARTFGLSGAIGLLGGIAHFGGQGNPYAWGVGSAMGSSATNALSHYLNAVPTITIRKGHLMMVYLPNDLLLPEYRP